MMNAVECRKVLELYKDLWRRPYFGTGTDFGVQWTTPYRSRGPFPLLDKTPLFVFVGLGYGKSLPLRTLVYGCGNCNIPRMITFTSSLESGCILCGVYVVLNNRYSFSPSVELFKSVCFGSVCPERILTVFWFYCLSGGGVRITLTSLFIIVRCWPLSR